MADNPNARERFGIKFGIKFGINVGENVEVNVNNGKLTMEN